MGLNLISFAFDVSGFAQGVIDLIDLHKKLEETRTSFQSAGEFEQAEQGVLDLMKLMVIDIFNLAHITRAGIY